jgi:hypothetical protein
LPRAPISTPLDASRQWISGDGVMERVLVDRSCHTVLVETRRAHGDCPSEIAKRMVSTSSGRRSRSRSSEYSYPNTPDRHLHIILEYSGSQSSRYSDVADLSCGRSWIVTDRGSMAEQAGSRALASTLYRRMIESRTEPNCTRNNTKTRRRLRTVASAGFFLGFPTGFSYSYTESGSS